jgi:uncharacterized protein
MQTPHRALVVSIHDVSPLTRNVVSEIVHDLCEAGVNRISLLVIPNHHMKAPIVENPAFCEWLGEMAEGREIVLHGYFHMRPAGAGGWWDAVVTEHYTAGEGEFYDLPQPEAASRLGRARREFAIAGLEPKGFIAPAWLLGDEAEKAVRDAGFEYTTRLRNFTDLVTGRQTMSQSLVWSVRSEWRRILSLWWNASLARKLREVPLMRVGLHPADWRHERIRKQAMELIRAALAGREVITYDDWLAHLRSQ